MSVPVFLVGRYFYGFSSDDIPLIQCWFFTYELLILFMHKMVTWKTRKKLTLQNLHSNNNDADEDNGDNDKRR